MNFNKYNLIKKSENLKIFKTQEKILNNLSENNLTDSVLKLSCLIATASLIEDYGEGTKILFDYFRECKNPLVLILGLEFSTHCDEKIFNYFVEYFMTHNENFPPFERACGYYLLAEINFIRKYPYISDEQIAFLEKSINITEENGLKFSNNYKMLSNLTMDTEKKFSYLKKAFDNIDLAAIAAVDPDNTDYYTNYNSYIAEFITGTTSAHNYKLLKEHFSE